MRSGSMRLVTTFGLGRLRPAPGTWGSLPPVLLAGVLLALGWGPMHEGGGEAAWTWARWVVYHGVLLAVFAVFAEACVARGDAAEARFGRKDAREIVADETAGQCLPLLFLPASALDTPASAAWTLAYAFLAFRVLDIVKPWPAHRLQRVPGGWGVLLDDLVAGAYAAALVQVLARATA